MRPFVSLGGPNRSELPSCTAKCAEYLGRKLCVQIYYCKYTPDRFVITITHQGPEPDQVLHRYPRNHLCNQEHRNFCISTICWPRPQSPMHKPRNALCCIIYQQAVHCLEWSLSHQSIQPERGIPATSHKSLVKNYFWGMFSKTKSSFFRHVPISIPNIFMGFWAPTCFSWNISQPIYEERSNWCLEHMSSDER